jgi:hypothetical protein
MPCMCLLPKTQIKYLLSISHFRWARVLDRAYAAETIPALI